MADRYSDRRYDDRNYYMDYEQDYGYRGGFRERNRYGPERGPVRGYARDYDYERDYEERPYRWRRYSREADYYPDYDREYDYRRNPYGEHYPDISQSEAGYAREDYDDYGPEYYYEEPIWSYTEMWMVPGPMTGYGPRNYQRSEDRIKEDICDRLTHHGLVDASDIEVQVENDEVTLNGTVNSRREKRMAEDTAESVSGIYDVHNHLRIKRYSQQNLSRGKDLESEETGKIEKPDRDQS